MTTITINERTKAGKPCLNWRGYTILPLKILVCFLVKNSGKYWDKCLFYSSKFEAKMVLLSLNDKAVEINEGSPYNPEFVEKILKAEKT